jgi:hypothetical protein
MQTTKVCTFSGLSPVLRSALEDGIDPKESIFYCAEGINVGTQGVNSGLILTQHKLLQANLVPGDLESKGHTLTIKYKDMKRLEENSRVIKSQNYDYLEIGVKRYDMRLFSCLSTERDGMLAFNQEIHFKDANVWVFFETPEMVQSFKTILKGIARLK